MKQIKNATLAVLGGLLILSVATVSCSKKSGGSPATPTIVGITPSASDTIGQVVTITGTNFTSSSTVTIGGIAATPVTFTSATSISVTIPAGVASATAVPVIVTTGTSVSTPSNITVVPGAGAFTIDGKNSSNQVETSSIIAHWTFDGSTSESISGEAPTLSGGTTTYVTGRIGQAVHMANAWLTYPTDATFAGVDNTGFSSNDTLQNGATVSLWAQVPDTSLLTTLFQLSGNIPGTANWPVFGIQYRKHADSTFDLDGGITNIDATSSYPTYAAAFGLSPKDNQSWAFVAMEYDTTGGPHLNYYFNGTLSGTGNVSSAFPSPEAFLLVTPNYASIGCAEGTGYTPGSSNAIAGYMSYGITGNIDDVRFYNKTLTATDIDDLYQLGNHGQ